MVEAVPIPCGANGRDWNGMDVQVPWRMDYGDAVATASNALLASYEDFIVCVHYDDCQIVDGGSFKAQLHQDALERKARPAAQRGCDLSLYQVTSLLPNHCSVVGTPLAFSRMDGMFAKEGMLFHPFLCENEVPTAEQSPWLSLRSQPAWPLPQVNLSDVQL